MKALPYFGLVILILAVLSFNSYPALCATGEEAAVRSVEVQINCEGQVYDGLVDRIEYSVDRVGERILLNQPVALLVNNESVIRTTIYNVFSRALTGFRVDDVSLQFGEHTIISIRLQPIQPLINEVKLNVKVNGVTPELEEFIQKAAAQSEVELNRFICGLPIESISWSENIINTVVNYLAEREFPGFSAHFSLKAGSQTELNISLTPKDPTVSSVEVTYHSESIPNWLVKYQTKAYQERLNLIKGLPVEFLAHYRFQLENWLSNYINDLPEMQQLGLTTALQIRPGVKTRIDFTVDSQYFRSKLEARYYVGTAQSFGNFQLYLGYNIGNYELFSRFYLGENPGGNCKIGFQAPLGPNFTGAFEYDTEKYRKDIWFHYHFERGDYLDWRLGLDGAPNEAAIGIYMSDNVNLELANYDRDFGVQIMFHF